VVCKPYNVYPLVPLIFHFQSYCTCVQIKNLHVTHTHSLTHTLTHSCFSPLDFGPAHKGGGDGGVMGGLLAMESPSGLKHNCGFPLTKRLLLQFPVHVIRKRHVDVGG